MLGERHAAGREKYHARTDITARRDVGDGVVKRLDLHEHAGTSAKGRIVNSAVTIVRPIAQVVALEVEKATSTSASHNRGGHIGFEKLGKDREGLDEHEHSPRDLQVEQTVHNANRNGALRRNRADHIIDDGNQDLAIDRGPQRPRRHSRASP